MKVIVTLDDNLGMLFGNKRQSKDRVLLNDIFTNVTDKIYITKFSEKLFLNYPDNVEIVDDSLDCVEDDDYVFIENLNVSDFEDKINELIIYRWNRSYPYDFTFDLDLDSFKLENSTEFVGSSHEKITKEIYSK